MKGLVILTVAVFSCIQAAPTDQRIAEVKEDLEPVHKQLEELSKTIQKSIQDSSKQARASFVNIADAGKALIAPIPEQERANAPEQLKKKKEDFVQSVQTAGRDMYKQGYVNGKSILDAQKAVADSTGEALRTIQQQLTEDSSKQ